MTGEVTTNGITMSDAINYTLPKLSAEVLLAMHREVVAAAAPVAGTPEAAPFILMLHMLQHELQHRLVGASFPLRFLP